MDLVEQLINLIPSAKKSYQPSFGELHHLGFLVSSNINLENEFRFERIIFHELMQSKMGYFWHSDIRIELIQPEIGSILHSSMPVYNPFSFDHCCYKTTDIDNINVGIKISEFYTELFSSKVVFFLLNDLTKIEFIEL
mgnify:CR=1 FL=1